ncbi:MAG: glycosyltransferase family 2 protein [Peptostreptococcaceae bacterium]
MTIEEGFSVVTSTYRYECIENLINNFIVQDFKNKELIVIINNDSIEISDFDIYTQKESSIKVYKLPQATNLGICLNFAISKAKYKYVAKFDDDDLYGKNYLKEAYNAFIKEDCDVVGKWQYLIYLEGENKILARPKDPRRSRQFAYVSWLPGATLCFKKSIFEDIEFSDINSQVDDDIMKKCVEKKLKIFSTSRNNFIAMRHIDTNKHTWKITHEKLIETCTLIKEDISFEKAYEAINNDDDLYTN